MSWLAWLFGPPRSLRRGLVVNVIIALFLCILIAVTILVKEFYEHLEERLDASLIAEATEVIGQIDPDAEFYSLNPDALRFRGVNGFYRYTVFDADGMPVVGGESSESIRAQLLELTLGSPRRIELSSARVGIALKALMKGQAVYALVSAYPQGEDVEPVDELLSEIKEQIGWVILGVIIIIGASTLATRRSLAPLQSLLAQAGRVGPATAQQRLDEAQVPTEIAPLIHEVNSAFDRLEHGYQAQRDFSSNVAHEIRTPIAVLRSTVERIPDVQLRQTLERDVGSLDQMFSQLIDLARADAALNSSFNAVDLHEIAVDAARELAQTALRHGRTLSLSGAAQSEVNGNAGLLKVALSNLISNALAYTPEGTEIQIEVLQDPPGWRVLDQGPGVPDALKSDLFERFNRGAQANSNSAGSGLGLAIVKSVAKSHDAVVKVEDRDGGGSVFSFIFNKS